MSPMNTLNPEPEPEPWTGLTVPERYGVFFWWPHEGTDWIHPDDIDLCEQLIPSDRIFIRERINNEFSQFIYGPHTIRLRASMWLEIQIDGYLIGDRVEIRSRMGKRRPAIGTIAEMRFNRHGKRIEYYLTVNEHQMETPLMVDEFQPAFKLNEPLTIRQKDLMDKSRIGSFR